MTYEEIKARAEVIRTSYAADSVTPEAVGGLMGALADYIHTLELTPRVVKVQLTELDAMVETQAAAIQMMKNPNRYTVLSKDIVVGTLAFIGDTSLHGVTQIFTTNLLLLPDGTFGADHSHGDVFTYHRTWVIRAAGGLTEVGKWTAWAAATGNPTSVTDVISEE